jgi:CheY-like chemotaxis protein
VFDDCKGEKNNEPCVPSPGQSCTRLVFLATMSKDAPDILLVEDSPTTAELFLFALQANKSRSIVHTVHDGQSAIDMVLGSKETPGVLPRLLLLDLHMPGIDGFDVLARLRSDERTRQLPVLVYSSSDQESDQREAMARGANGFVHKPVGFEDACKAIARIERDWLSPPTSTA